jgi:anoctamin-10
MKDEKLAFFNAMIFFSNEFYFQMAPEEEVSPLEAEINNLLQEANKQIKLDFAAEIEKWIVEDEEDFKEVQVRKILYKEKVLFNFIKIMYANETMEIGGGILQTTILQFKHTKATDQNQSGLEVGNESFLKQKDKATLFPLLFDPSVSNLKRLQTHRLLKNHFSILMRRVIRLRFRTLGLWTRTFYSNDFSHLFMVIKAQKASIYARAELDKYTKQIEPGVVDLISFEPLDELNRPYRLKKNDSFIELEQIKKKLDPSTFEIYMSNARDTFDGLRATGGDVRSVGRIISLVSKLTDFELVKLIQLRTIDYRKYADKFFSAQKSSALRGRIIEDTIESKSEWIAFIVYVSMFEFYFKATKKMRFYDEFKKYSGLVNRLVALKALRDTNLAFKARAGIFSAWKDYFVHSVWNRLKIEDSVSPYAEFKSSKNFENVWRTYESNELGKREVFMQMDRIKLVMSMVQHSIEIFDLIKTGFIKDYFPIHDPFVVNGDPKTVMLVDVIDIEQLLNKTDNAREKGIKNFLEIMKENAEVSDFLEQRLVDDLRFQFFHPWSISIDAARDYFGEKIAIYLSLQIFYTRYKAVIGFIGIIVFILQQAFLSNSQVIAYKAITLVYVVILLLWIILFGEFWKREQALFAMRYGQLTTNETEEKIKPGFIGRFIRDLSSNAMNVLFFSPLRRAGRVAITFTISFLFIALSIATSIGILIWRKSYIASSFFEQLFPIFVNAIQIIIFNLVYHFLAVNFTNYENHKTIQEYEDSLIMKLFTFSFANTFNSFVIIAFVKPYTESIFGTCVSQTAVTLPGVDCFNELSYQLRFLFIIQFFLSFLKIVKPWAIQKLKRKLYESSRKHIKTHPWQNVDTLIEKESIKEDYVAALQIDGSLFDILDLIIEFAFIAFFSVTFPLAGIIGFFGGIASIHMDKYRLMHYFKRPTPYHAPSIGSWQTIIEALIYFAIIVNSAIFAFTLRGMQESAVITVTTGSTVPTTSNEDNVEAIKQNLPVFIAMLIAFIVFKFVLQFFIPDLPSNFDTILQRHKNIAKKLLTKEFSSSTILSRAGVYMSFPNKSTEEMFKDEKYILEVRDK